MMHISFGDDSKSGGMNQGKLPVTTLTVDLWLLEDSQRDIFIF